MSCIHLLYCDKSHYQNFTPPFDIPESWQWVKIDEIASSNIGLTYSPQDIVDDGVPVYRSNNIRDNKICLDDIVYVSCPILEKQYLNNGDLLICARNGSRRLVGKNVIIENLERPTSFGAFMAVCRSCYNPWIKLLLDSAYFNSYLDESNSTAINQITQKMLLDFILPLPPKEEQSRIISAFHSIVGVIDGIDQSKKNLSESIANLKSKILDLAMQGKLVPQDPADEPAAEMLRRVNPKAKIITDNPHYTQLPDNWVYLSLSDINTYKSSTVTPANMPEQLFDLYSVPIFSTLTPENIHGGEIGSAKQVINKGDVLLCKINPHLNRVWEIIEDSHNVQIASSEWIVVRSELHHPSFLKWYFNSPEFRALLSSQVSGVGGSLTRAQPAIVKGYLVPVPPMEEQARISKAIEHWFECLDSIISGLSN